MRFVVLADTHFVVPGQGKDGIYWNRTLCSRSDEIGKALVESISLLHPEFVIHCGDLTGLCDMANYEMGCQIMDQLGCPWFLVTGNHETWYPGIRALLSDRYELPQGQCYYSRFLAGSWFVFLDLCYWQARDCSISPYLDKELYDRNMIEGLVVPPEEMRWLRNELESHKNEKVIIVGHAPIAFKNAYPSKQMPGSVTNRHELQALIREYRNVVMALSGHWHINDVYVEEGTVFCQTCSMREYPFEFRLVEVGADILSITTHGLRDPAFKLASFIPEKRNDWVAGTTADREFSVQFCANSVNTEDQR